MIKLVISYVTIYRQKIKYIFLCAFLCVPPLLHKNPRQVFLNENMLTFQMLCVHQIGIHYKL